MKISKDLQWLDIYIDAARTLLPEIKKLKRVSSRVPKKSMTENQLCHGIISKYYNGFDHRITLYTKFLDMNIIKDEVKLSIKPYSRIDTLCFFAHELAHLRYWDHTPEHKQMEAILTHLFMMYLQSSGYKSEEDEIGYYQWCRRQ